MVPFANPREQAPAQFAGKPWEDTLGLVSCSLVPRKKKTEGQTWAEPLEAGTRKLRVWTSGGQGVVMQGPVAFL